MKDYVRLLTVATIVALCGFLMAQTRGESPDSVREAIKANLEENYAASNVEDLPRLLKTMSREMPQRQLFISACRQEWAESDIYHRLVDVQVLEHSDAEYSSCEYPYATALVTQQSVPVRSDNFRVLRKNCPDGRCPQNDDDLAHIFGLKPKWETVQLQMLFKHEGGKWKLVAGLTNPEPVAESAELEAVAGPAFN